jgi:branched-subunit amino acid ABC-type transport system permease component
MLGGYLSVFLIKNLGSSDFMIIFSLLAFSAILTGLIGAIVERGFLSFTYKREFVFQMLLTYGFTLVFDDMAKIVWGLLPVSASEPFFVLGTTTIIGALYPVYNLFIIIVALIIALLLWILIYKTNFGRILRAVSMDREMASSLGANPTRYYLGAFVIGAALAGFAGSLMVPFTSVFPGVGSEVLAESFIVIVIGGLGSLKGAFVGALLIGLLRSIGISLFPELELALLFLLAVIVLIIRPQGLFGGK